MIYSSTPSRTEPLLPDRAGVQHVSLTPPGEVEVMDYWDKQNVRRYRLIQKKNRGGLSASEVAEYDLLTKEIESHLQPATAVFTQVLSALGDDIRDIKTEIAKKGKLN